MSPPEGPRDHAPAAEWVHVSDLHPWPGNYNDHGPEQLEALHAAIDRRGWGAPILAHRGTGQVVDGHGRLEVALAKIAEDPAWQLPDAPGPGQVPVRWRDGTWEECEEEALAANLIPRLSRIDDRRMGQVLAAVSSRQGGVSDLVARSVGLERERVSELLHRARPKDPATTPPPPELEPPKRPKSKPGEVYQLGPHRLRCGDSLDVDGLRELLHDGPADLCFMDPPYAIYGSSTGIGRDIADDGMIRDFFKECLLHASASLRLFGLAWVCCDWRSWPSWFECAKGTDMAVKNAICWDKRGSGLGNQYAQTYEMIGYYVKSPVERAFMSTRKTGIRGVHAPNVFHVEGDPITEGEPLPRQFEGDPGAAYDKNNAFQNNRVTGSERVHNAQKPVDLLVRVMKPAVRPGEVVLDLFGGSGSTMIAAEKLGLHARLSERSPAWCDVIRKRWGLFARDLGIDPGPGAL